MLKTTKEEKLCFSVYAKFLIHTVQVHEDACGAMVENK